MEDYSELMKAVKAYDWGRSGAPLLEINAEIRKILGHAGQIQKLESALLEVLRSDAPLAAKRGVCKRLGLIAGERAVPVLEAMLTADDTADMARYALEQIPSPAVDTALRNALSKARGKARTGIIQSIGNRRDRKATAALGPFLADPDELVAGSAAWALGRIGGEEAIRLLGARKGEPRARVRTEVLDAWLVCARRLASEGRKTQAMAIYRELSAETMPAPVRRAASIAIKAAEAL
jgi:HEAT repeat protein